MSSRKKISIILITTFLIMANLIYFVTLPSIQKIQEFKNDILLEKKDLEIKYKKGLLLKETRASMMEIEKNKDYLNDIFIQEGEEFAFANHIEKLAHESQLKLDLVPHDIRETEKKEIKIFPLTLHLEGDFIKTLEFIQKTETQKYYFNIKSISFTAKKSQTGMAQTVIEGEVFTKIF